MPTLRDAQPTHWLRTCATYLIDLLNVIALFTGLQVDQEQLPQDRLGDEVIAGLADAGAALFGITPSVATRPGAAEQYGQTPIFRRVRVLRGRRGTHFRRLEILQLEHIGSGGQAKEMQTSGGNELSESVETDAALSVLDRIMIAFGLDLQNEEGFAAAGPTLAALFRLEKAPTELDLRAALEDGAE